jgi:hypothetical protein
LIDERSVAVEGQGALTFVSGALRSKSHVSVRFQQGMPELNMTTLPPRLLEQMRHTIKHPETVGQ